MSKSKKNGRPGKDAGTGVSTNTSAGVCAFIDLLGFGGEVTEAASFVDLAAIAERLERVRMRFDFEAEGTTLEVQDMLNKEVLAFSDSIIVWIPFESQLMDLDGDFDPLLSELSGFALAQGMGVVDDGDFVRGGIELGWWYRKGPTLISEALVYAHALETRADVPVLAVGPRAFEHIDQHGHRGFYAPDADPVKKLFRYYEETYKGKLTAFYYLDYIRTCVESLDAWDTKQRYETYVAALPGDERQAVFEAGITANTERWFVRHAAEIAKAHAAAPEHAKSKYVWLAGYHNEKQAEYLTSTTGQCVLG